MKTFNLFAALAALCLCGLTSPAVEIIAHRGASHDAPENTVASFKLGWQQHADADETDIWPTKDGKLIISHDENTKRITGVEKKIPRETFADLRALDAGAWKGPQWKGEKLATLDEALATMPAGKRFFIEIKPGPEALPVLMPELKRVLAASGRKHSELVIIAFSLEVARVAKEKLPTLKVYWLYDWKKDKDTDATFSPDELIAKAKAAKLDGLDLSFKGPIDATYVKKVKDAGLKFYAWTVDDAVEAKKLVAFGVDGITTNRPQWLREQLGTAR
jgi:glycerophosphoryl diester phosphodiesterase